MSSLGIYTDVGELDHDTALLVEGVIDTLAARDVSRDVAVKAILRVVGGLR